MASFLRQIVAGPRLQHPEAGLDLCYVTDNLIATSGPSSNYPKLAYRTPLKDLVNFLDKKHGENWCIWEFRAEGTGYPDSEVYGRIHHFPFPDHHPPPFALIPKVMASMRNWLQRLDNPSTSTAESDTEGSREQGTGQRVAVVHCKAGKGRSGTIACSYLISQEGWKMDDALQRFTERRMRVGFGSGVSIPSQLRWVRYVDRWTNEMGKKYVERPVEILEVHIWGLRDGVKVAVEGFIDHGQKIKRFHLFHRNERTVLAPDGSLPDGKDHGNGHTVTTTTTTTTTATANSSQEPLSAESDSSASPTSTTLPMPGSFPNTSSTSTSTSTSTEPTVTAPTHPDTPQKHTTAVLLRPKTPILLPTSDINIDFERRSKAAYTGLAMVTTVAHVWFNPFFEGGDRYDSGVFEIEWNAMDGIKGTTKKGIKAFDKLNVVWRYSSSATGTGATVPGPVSSGLVMEPGPGEHIPESQPADWRLRDTDVDVDVGEEEGEEGSGEETPPQVRAGDKENIPMQVAESTTESVAESVATKTQKEPDLN